MPSVVLAHHLSASRRTRRVVLIAVSAGLIGAVAGAVRPYLGGSVHFDAVISAFILMPLMSLLILVTLRRVAGTSVWFLLQVEIFVQLCCFTAPYSLQIGPLWDDMLGLMLVHWLFTTAISNLLFFLIRLRQVPHTGPYCPQCAYCLVGSANNLCSECGRPYSLEELNVAPGELEPRNFQADSTV